MRMDFLPVDEADTEELVALRVAAMRDSLERIGRFDPQRARERFLASYMPQHTRHIMFEHKRVGFVAVKPLGDELLLDHLYIDPKYQSLGIGTAVLQRVIAEADILACGIRVGALKGSGSNRFYIRNGFTLVEEAEWDNYYLRRAGSV